ncbi:MAG: tripartite tricarboxylate transporter substrate binding protein [Burkholderiales bacterium]|nr:tripartite tricarboxylate transporter substrate binding protein [Burkholderiales bacterium]
MNNRILAVLTGVLCTLCATAAAGADYPTKPIRLVVPFPAGGPVDITARTLAPRLTEALGQRLVIDNRGGAGGILGSDIVAKSPADGHTLLLCTTGNAINVSLVPNLPYDIRKDFAPVSMVAIITSILVVHPALPVKSVKGLIALARAQPDALSYASTGNGAPTHLAGELFKSMASVKILHVPYKGAAPAVVDLLSGHVQLSFISAPGVMPHVRNNRLRVLAVTNARRSVLLPEVPTLDEAGLRGYESEGWHGLFTPAGTPKPVIDRLYKEFSTLLRDPKIGAQLIAGGAEPVGMPPAEFAVKLHNEIEKWAKVVKNSGMKVD